MADRSYIATNDAARERLRAFVGRLTEDDMQHPLGGGWTVSAALCHLAFFDRLWLGKFEEWERAGRVAMTTVPIDADAINAAMLPWWLSVSFDYVRRDVVAAAEAIDRRAQTLSDAVVEQIMAIRPRTIVRAVHRNAHLDHLEQVLRGGD